MITSLLQRMLLTLLLLGFGQAVLAAESVSLDELLKQVESGRARDAEENAARMDEFKANKAKQAELLEQMRAQGKAQEQRSQNLETAFGENDIKIGEVEEALKERLGSLKELFGVIQQVAGDTRGQFENSLTQVQYPGRTEFLTKLAQKMGETNLLASLEDIEQLWFELHRET